MKTEIKEVTIKDIPQGGVVYFIEYSTINDYCYDAVFTRFETESEDEDKGVVYCLVITYDDLKNYIIENENVIYEPDYYDENDGNLVPKIQVEVFSTDGLEPMLVSEDIDEFIDTNTQQVIEDYIKFNLKCDLRHELGK